MLVVVALVWIMDMGVVFVIIALMYVVNMAWLIAVMLMLIALVSFMNVGMVFVVVALVYVVGHSAPFSVAYCPELGQSHYRVH